MTTDIKISNLGGLEIVDGDLQLITEDAQAVQQRVMINLKLFRGEWWLDISKGVPYFQEILTKSGSKEAADALFKEAILSTTGVSGLLSYSSTLNKYTGEMMVSFEATTTGGDIISIQNQEI